jgi:hypothetical protein
MLGTMCATGALGEKLEDPGDSTRPVCGDLLSNTEVQAHVQERIGLAAVDREITPEIAS